MTEALDALTADIGLPRRMAAMSAACNRRPGTVAAAEFIETVGRTPRRRCDARGIVSSHAN